MALFVPDDFWLCHAPADSLRATGVPEAPLRYLWGVHSGAGERFAPSGKIDKPAASQ